MCDAVVELCLVVSLTPSLYVEFYMKYKKREKRIERERERERESYSPNKLVSLRSSRRIRDNVQYPLGNITNLSNS